MLARITALLARLVKSVLLAWQGFLMLKKEHITAAKINHFFYEFSAEYGYNAEKYLEEVLDLIDKWEQQGFVEVYKETSDRLHGRAKESDSDAQGRLVIEYIGLYHVRLRANFNDPLLVIKFTKDEQDKQYVSIRFITDHEKLFGCVDQKRDKITLSQLRQDVDANIQKGDQGQDN